MLQRRILLSRLERVKGRAYIATNSWRYQRVAPTVLAREVRAVCRKGEFPLAGRKLRFAIAINMDDVTQVWMALAAPARDSNTLGGGGGTRSQGAR